MTEMTGAPWLPVVRAYHERTKHRLERYAAGPSHLDWDRQPDPFRRFAGADLIPLALPPGDEGPTLDALASAGGPAITLERLGALLELSLGLSAWKAYGPDRWALRCNPSSGNLHPTEGYLAARGLPGLADGVYHYAPHEHALERRCRFPVATAADGPRVLVGLSSIAWREAWKYGERAFRYVQLDVGHALGAIRYAAAVLGWNARLLPWPDGAVAGLLGLDRSADFAGADRESPDLLLWIGPDSATDDDLRPEPWLTSARAGDWTGTANPLGGFPRPEWPVIGEVAEATHADDARGPEPWEREPVPAPVPSGCQAPLARLIRQRRSAQAYDGRTAMDAPDLYRMLDALLPRPGTPPWDAWPYRARLHPVLFIHRVNGLEPGLYALVRTGTTGTDALRSAFRQEFEWRRPDGCPEHLPFYRLVAADARAAARAVSCHQDIASASGFSLGMLAEFDAALGVSPAAYRHLYWEAGLMGQVLYLEAEAAGLRGTGIGCFFDDVFHEILGLADTRYQSLYHFTVGQPKTDPRIQTLPAYGHLPAGRQAPG